MARTRRQSLLGVGVVFLIGAVFGMVYGSHVHATPAEAASTSLVTLDNIRAIRLSDTAISFSFITDEPSIGVIEFVDIDGSTVTLSDSNPQKDHLFTVEPLDPARGYSFSLSAAENSKTSNRYVILLAPELIGTPGQSIEPPIDVYASDGTKISSSHAASTTPADTDSLPVWPFIVTPIGVVGAWFAYRALRARMTSKL